MHQLILASQSPRRYELLLAAGFEFSVVSVQISEIPNENLNLTDQIQQLAQDKARALVESGKLSKSKGYLILSADTVVVLDDHILGKPKDLFEAEVFLRQLSGRMHRVITGLCLWDLDSGRVHLAHATANVHFRKLTDGEIKAYAQSGEGLDKAGAYGAQGQARQFIEKIEGDEQTVIGLPIRLLIQLLNENGYVVRRKATS